MVSSTPGSTSSHELLRQTHIMTKYNETEDFTLTEVEDIVLLFIKMDEDERKAFIEYVDRDFQSLKNDEIGYRHKSYIGMKLLVSSIVHYNAALFTAEHHDITQPGSLRKVDIKIREMHPSRSADVAAHVSHKTYLVSMAIIAVLSNCGKC